LPERLEEDSSIAVGLATEKEWLHFLSQHL